MRRTVHYPLTVTSLQVTPAEIAAAKAASPRPLGRYQRLYLTGYYRPSGSDLIGTARKYGGHYRRSRQRVEALLAAAGVDLVEVIGAHGRRSLWSLDALARHLQVSPPAGEA